MFRMQTVRAKRATHHGSRRNAVEEAGRAVAEYGVGPDKARRLLRPQVLDPRLAYSKPQPRSVGQPVISGS